MRRCLSPTSLFALSAFFSAFLAAGCGGGEAGGAAGAGGQGASAAAGAGAAVGTWVTDGGATSLALRDGGAFEMTTRKGQHVTGTWQLAGERLTLTGGGEGALAGTFAGRLAGGKLELTFGPKTSVYERQ